MNALPDQSAFTDAALSETYAGPALATAQWMARQRETAIVRGVAALIHDPWRANHIIPYAKNMSLGALIIEVARRLRGAPEERRVGLLQLRAALATEAFCDAWETYRADHCEVAS